MEMSVLCQIEGLYHPEDSYNSLQPCVVLFTYRLHVLLGQVEILKPAVVC